MNFKVCNSPSNSYALDNVVAVRNDCFTEYKYVKINNTHYVIRKCDDIQSGYIGLSGHIRKDLQCAFDSEITVIPIHDDELHNIIGTAHKMSFVITQRLGPSKEPSNVAEDDLKAHILHKFNNYPLSHDQPLLTQFNTDKIMLISKNDGFIGIDTDIEITSLCQYFTIMKEDLINRKFFDPNFSFEDIGIGGLDDNIRKIFIQSLSSRAHDPKLIEKLGITHAKGLLLFGPPGTGKTLIARNIGSLLSNIKPKVVNGPEIMNKYVGQSEENIRNLFAEAINDQESLGNMSPLHIIIFDEIDAICPSRGSSSGGTGVSDNVVNQLLSMIDGVNQLNNIFIIGMTNRKDLLDPALLRKGRIDQHIQIGMPDRDGRLQILKIHTLQMKDNKFFSADVDLGKIADLTENYTGSELMGLIQDVGNLALHASLLNNGDTIIEDRHFMQCIHNLIPMMGTHLSDIMEIQPSYDKSRKIIYDHLNKNIDMDNGMLKKNLSRQILIVGNDASYGAQKLYCEIPCEFKRLLDTKMFIGKTPIEKNNMLVKAWNDCSQYTETLIVIDDVDTLIDFSCICNAINFSNSTYQTLQAILKTISKENKTNIVIVVNNENLFQTVQSILEVKHQLITMNGDK